jgi:anti-sigma regulatory factor (Ser/Thr protein kinase)
MVSAAAADRSREVSDPTHAGFGENIPHCGYPRARRVLLYADNSSERQDEGVVTEREFACDAHTPSAARSFATDTLRGQLGSSLSPDLRYDVELIISELVTNAVRAGSRNVIVCIDVQAGTVIVRVKDQASGWPEQRQASIHDAGGRGLPLVSALSAAWGVRTADAGKVVWAEVPVLR